MQLLWCVHRFLMHAWFQALSRVTSLLTPSSSTTYMHVLRRHLLNGEWRTSTSSLLCLKWRLFRSFILPGMCCHTAEIRGILFLRRCLPVFFLFFFYALLRRCTACRLHILWRVWCAVATFGFLLWAAPPLLARAKLISISSRIPQRVTACCSAAYHPAWRDYTCFQAGADLCNDAAVVGLPVLGTQENQFRLVGDNAKDKAKVLHLFRFPDMHYTIQFSALTRATFLRYGNARRLLFCKLDEWELLRCASFVRLWSIFITRYHFLKALEVYFRIVIVPTHK